MAGMRLVVGEGLHLRERQVALQATMEALIMVMAIMLEVLAKEERLQELGFQE